MTHLPKFIVFFIVILILFSSFPLISFPEELEVSGELSHELYGRSHSSRAEYETPNKNLDWTMTELVNDTGSPVARNGTFYEVTGNVTISVKDTLTIRAGEELRFSNDTKLTILGNLKVQGTPGSMARLTVNDTGSDNYRWKGIIFDARTSVDKQRNSLVDHCIIERTTNSVLAINSSFSITNSILRTGGGQAPSSGHSGIYLNRSKAVVEGNLLEGGWQYGVFIGNSNGPRIANNTITNSSTCVCINETVAVTIAGNHFSPSVAGIIVTNNSRADIEYNDFEHYHGTGIIVKSDRINITGNHFQFIKTGIISNAYRDLRLVSNVLENVTDGIVLSRVSNIILSQNVVNYTTSRCIYIEYSDGINFTGNRIYNHFGDGINLTESDDVSVYRNEFYFGRGTSLVLRSCLAPMVVGNRFYYNFGNGLRLDGTVPEAFNSNLFNGTAGSDMKIYGKLTILSINNTFEYNKLVLGPEVKLTVRNYFSVLALNRNNDPMKDVQIEIRVNDVPTHEYLTDINGTVTLLLTYRQYDGPTSIKQDQLILIAKYEDYEFDFSPFELDISKSTTLLLRANRPPQLTIKSPPANSTLSGVVYINGTAFDPDTPIKAIQIQLGMSPWMPVTPDNPEWTLWHFELDTAEYTNGYYQLNFSITDGYSTGTAFHPVIIFNGGSGSDRLSVDINRPVESEAVWDTIIIKGTTTAAEHDILAVLVQIDNYKWENATAGSDPASRSYGAAGSRFELQDWSKWSYNLNTRHLNNGEHRINAIITDGYDVAVDSISIFVTNVEENESVDFHADFETPDPGETVSGTVYITGIVWGTLDPVESFILYVNEKPVSDTNNVIGPNWWVWNYTWDTTKEKNGPNEIKVWARNRTTSMLDDMIVIVENKGVEEPPSSELSIVILKPTDAAIVNRTIKISGITWSESEEITSVSIRINEGSWYPADMEGSDWTRWSRSWDTTDVENGIYTIHAMMTTATDSATDSVTVFVRNPEKISELSIVITRPLDGAVVSGTVEVKGYALYGDYAIISVDVQFGYYLWAAAEPLKDDWREWRYGWNTTVLENGTYTLQCRVFDGYSTAKYSIEVEIKNENGTGHGNGVEPTNGDPDGDVNITTDDEDNSGLIQLVQILITVNIIIIAILIMILLRIRRRDVSKTYEGTDMKEVVGTEEGSIEEEE